MEGVRNMMTFNFVVRNMPHRGIVQLYASVYDDGQTIDTVRMVRIKRREENSQSYITIAIGGHWNQHPVREFVLEHNDFLCRNDTNYVYVAEWYPLSTNSNEQSPIHTEEVTIKSEFNLLVISDFNNTYRTPLNVSAINTTLIRPYSTNVPIYTQKPSYYCNTAVSYEEGTCKGIWLQMFDCQDPSAWEGNFRLAENYKYRRQFKDWLVKGNAKIIKNIMGEMWMVGIKTDSISDNSLFDSAEIEGARQIEFGWFEVGDPENEKDLYYNGLINVSSDDWSGQ